MSETRLDSVPPIRDRPFSPARELLKDARTAAPCKVCWEEMPGGERVRSCARCHNKVYDLSGISAAEAADLLRKAEGGLRSPVYCRSDGSFMTRDCPGGRRVIRDRAAKGIAIAFASLIFACGVAQTSKPRDRYPLLLRFAMNQITPAAKQAPPSSFVSISHAPLRRSPNNPVIIPADPTLSAAGDKPFLRGLEMPPDSARPDPFLPERAAARPDAVATAARSR